MTVHWNTDKPHRCPRCHTVVDAGQSPTWRAVYECCRCWIRFARWPWLVRFLPTWVFPVRTCVEPHEAYPDPHWEAR